MSDWFVVESYGRLIRFRVQGICIKKLERWRELKKIVDEVQLKLERL